MDEALVAPSSVALDQQAYVIVVGDVTHAGEPAGSCAGDGRFGAAVENGCVYLVHACELASERGVYAREYLLPASALEFVPDG